MSEEYFRNIIRQRAKTTAGNHVRSIRTRYD